MSKSASQGMPQFDGSLLRSKEPKKHVILVAFSPPFCLLYLSLSLLIRRIPLPPQHGYQMALSKFLDCMCLTLRA